MHSLLSFSHCQNVLDYLFQLMKSCLSEVKRDSMWSSWMSQAVAFLVPFPFLHYVILHFAWLNFCRCRTNKYTFEYQSWPHSLTPSMFPIHICWKTLNEMRNRFSSTLKFYVSNISISNCLLNIFFHPTLLCLIPVPLASRILQQPQPLLVSA